ncbi:hypothetical protein HOY80DRAFT_611791 [Tuber brumale]|nr:hypothetical protein HOY80DRAFT_611791 [Tuber brumale]
MKSNSKQLLTIQLYHHSSTLIYHLPNLFRPRQTPPLPSFSYSIPPPFPSRNLPPPALPFHNPPRQPMFGSTFTFPLFALLSPPAPLYSARAPSTLRLRPHKKLVHILTHGLHHQTHLMRNSQNSDQSRFQYREESWLRASFSAPALDCALFLQSPGSWVWSLAISGFSGVVELVEVPHDLCGYCGGWSVSMGLGSKNGNLWSVFSTDYSSTVQYRV